MRNVACIQGWLRRVGWVSQPGPHPLTADSRTRSAARSIHDVDVEGLDGRHTLHNALEARSVAGNDTYLGSNSQEATHGADVEIRTAKAAGNAASTAASLSCCTSGVFFPAVYVYIAIIYQSLAQKTEGP